LPNVERVIKAVKEVLYLNKWFNQPIVKKASVIIGAFLLLSYLNLPFNAFF
jgi:hypothetical protein